MTIATDDDVCIFMNNSCAHHIVGKVSSLPEWDTVWQRENGSKKATYTVFESATVECRQSVRTNH